MVRKKLHMPVNLNGLEVIEFLSDAYPKIENAGGVEICQTSRGSRKVEVIKCSTAMYERGMGLRTWTKFIQVVWYFG